MATCARDGVQRATPASTPSHSTQAGARHRKRAEPVAFFPSSPPHFSHRHALLLSIFSRVSTERHHRCFVPFAAVAVLFSSHFLASVATPSPVSSSSLRLHRLPLPLHLLCLRRTPPALSHRQLPCLSLFSSSFIPALSFHFGHQDRAPPSPPQPSATATAILLSGSSTVCKLPPLPCSSAPTTIYRCLHLSSPCRRRLPSSFLPSFPHPSSAASTAVADHRRHLSSFHRRRPPLVPVSTASADSFLFFHRRSPPSLRR